MTERDLLLVAATLHAAQIERVGIEAAKIDLSRWNDEWNRVVSR